MSLILKILLIAIIVLALFALLAPFVPYHQPKPYLLICQTNIRSILLATLIYREEHNGQLPGSIDDLLSSGDIISHVGLSAKHFVCPALRIDPKGNLSSVADWTSYKFLFDNYDASLSDFDACLLYCPPENHNGRLTNAGFLDGRAIRITIEDYNDILTEQKGGLRKKEP